MEEALVLGFVSIQQRTDRYEGGVHRKRVGDLAAEEIEASIDSALQGKTLLRQLHIDTAPIRFVSLYQSLQHVRGTLEQLKLDVSGDVPWSFLCKVAASCPRLRSLQLSCGALVGEFPSDLVLRNLVYLSLMPLSPVSRYLSVLSLDALSTLVKSARSLETLIVGELCLGERATARTPNSEPNGARIAVDSESLKHLYLQRGNVIDIELRAPNLETLRIKGNGACVVHSALGRLATLEHEINRTSVLDFRCAPPASLKTVVLHSVGVHLPKFDDKLVLDNVESLFCPSNILDILVEKCGAKLRTLGLIDGGSYYSRLVVNRLIKSCQDLETILTECKCGSLEELIIPPETVYNLIPAEATPWNQLWNACTRRCDFCAKGSVKDRASKPTLSTVVFDEFGTGNWPAISSASPEELVRTQNTDIDLSMIRDEDWYVNVYAVEVSTVKRSARTLIAPFYFTGCLPQELSSSIVVYLRKDLPPNSLGLPAKDEDVQQLLQQCADAVSVSDEEDVYNPKSVKLDTKHFMSSFQPSGCGIQDELRKCFGTGLNIVLHKLNVYRPGDFFSSHRVTPREGLVGTLVVVLPGNHTGGELLVRNKGVEHCLSIQDSSKVHWAAFYSDCEHEMKELTSGFRLTLTYNLYQCRKRASAEVFDATNLPFYHELMRLRTMRINESVLLGVACRCSYPFSRGEKGKTSEEMASMLKGEDAMVFATAKAAGLKPAVVQVWSCKEKEEQMFMTSTISSDFICADDREESVSKCVPEFKRSNKRDIVWVNREDLDLQVGGTMVRDVDETYLSHVYRAVAILMYVNVQVGEEDDVLEARVKRRKDETVHWEDSSSEEDEEEEQDEEQDEEMEEEQEENEEEMEEEEEEQDEDEEEMEEK